MPDTNSVAIMPLELFGFLSISWAMAVGGAVVYFLRVHARAHYNTRHFSQLIPNWLYIHFYVAVV